MQDGAPARLSYVFRSCYLNIWNNCGVKVKAVFVSGNTVQIEYWPARSSVVFFGAL